MTTTTDRNGYVDGHRRRRRRRPRSLRPSRRCRGSAFSPKLLVMLLVTSVLSAAVVGAIGYQSGRSSLRASVFDRLTEIRGSQSRQLEAKFTDLEDVPDHLHPRGDDHRSHRGIHRRDSTNSTLDDQPGPMAVDRRLLQQPVRRRPNRTQTGNAVDVDALLPSINAQKYLQAYYTAPFNDWDKAIRFDDARDGSAWSAANARFNDFFREIVLRFEFEDALLLDTRGQCGLHRLQGCRSRHQHPHRPVSARVHCVTLTKRRWRPTPWTMSASPTSATTSQPTNRPRGWSSPVGPPGTRRRRSRAAVPDLQDQPVDDRGQKVGSTPGWARPARHSWWVRTG